MCFCTENHLNFLKTIGLSAYILHNPTANYSNCTYLHIESFITTGLRFLIYPYVDTVFKKKKNYSNNYILLMPTDINI